MRLRRPALAKALVPCQRAGGGHGPPKAGHSTKRGHLRGTPTWAQPPQAARAEASLEKQALLEEQLRSKELQEQELAQLQLQSNLDKANLSDRWVLEGAVRQASLEHIAGILGQRGVCSPTMVPSPVCAWPVYPGPLFGRGEDRFRGLLPRFSVQPPLPVVKNPSASAGD